MQAKTTIRKQFFFQHRNVAVDCAIQSLNNPKVTDVQFEDRAWLKEGNEEKYQVIETSIE